jgi:hypothetical protein
MTVIALRTFSGMNQGVNPEILPDDAAQNALNTKLIYGDLRPWKVPLTIATPTKAGTKQTIYRFGENGTDESQYWFSWTTDVNIVRAPIDNDTTERTYYTGDGYPKVTNATRALTGGTDYPVNYYRLGVPPPNTSTMIAAVSGVATDATSVAYSTSYVLTYVSSQGEESAPSDPTTIVSYKKGQTVTLTNIPAGTFRSPYNAWSNVDVATKRIYRSNSGSTGTNFQFVAEIALATASYVDTTLPEALQEVVETWGWLPPPEDMQGLVLMANGIGMGFADNTIYPSEPFALYAYPLTYQISTETPIVGLGAFGQSVFVGTKANPYVLSGSSPESLTMTKLPQKQACVSKRSIVEMNGGVIYASPDGLQQITEGGGLSPLTSAIINRDEWQSYVPESIQAFELDNRYYAFYDNGTTQGCLVFDFSNKPHFHKLDAYATAGYNDRRKDSLYLAIGSNIQRWDGGSTNYTMTWKSKKYRFSSQINMGAGKVDADGYPVTLKLYADGALKHTQTVANNSTFKLPAGYRAEKYEIQIESAYKINTVAVGETVRDIRQVYV